MEFKIEYKWDTWYQTEPNLSKPYRIRTLLASKEGVKKTKSVQILPNLTTSHSYGISDFGGRSLRNLKSSNFLLNQRAILILKMPLDKPGGGTQQKEHTCRAARVCGRDAGASQALSRVVMTAHSKGALVLAALQQKLAHPCLRFHATFHAAAPRGRTRGRSRPPRPARAAAGGWRTS